MAMLLPLGKTPNLGFTTSREHPSVRSIPVYAMYLPFLLSSMWAQELFLTDTAAAFQRARQEKKHLFIYFTATWCGPCRFLEREVWPLPQFQALTSRFVRLKVIAQSEEASTPGSEALRLRYGI
ncbi:MAG: thioredoxin family protein, partial [Bacteroidia bacterium]|nr:thioredoxin family protein [Bacteroidia bacterium]